MTTEIVLVFLGLLYLNHHSAQNSAVGVIFDAWENDNKSFSIFRKFPIILELGLKPANET